MYDGWTAPEKWTHPRQCKTCGKFKCVCDIETHNANQAAHDICNIAPALRFCDDCLFQPQEDDFDLAELKELVYMIPPDPVKFGSAKWFEGVPQIEF